MSKTQIIHETNTHKAETSAGAKIGISKRLQERSWRNSELERTDLLVLIPDHPDKDRLISYRAALREYPTSEGFPDGERPKL